MSDLADHAAATAAGYFRIQQDRGVGKSPRFVSRYERPMVGEPGQAGHLWKADGNSDVSQAAADTAALAALNGQRVTRYGAGVAAGKGGRGGQHTFDVT